MAAGKRDRRITILRPVIARDAAGAEIRTYVRWIDRWAQVADVDGSETYESHERRSSRGVKFRMLFVDGLTAQHRIEHDGREYDVLAIEEIGRRHELVVTARTRDVEA